MTYPPKEKQFDTYIVASAITGIGLGPASFSDMHEVYDMLLGEGIFTHEMAHAPTVDACTEEGYRQFPEMPTKAEAQEDYAAAREKAERAYGPFVTVKRGAHKRRETPVETLEAMAPSEKIITLTQ